MKAQKPGLSTAQFPTKAQSVEGPSTAQQGAPTAKPLPQLPNPIPVGQLCLPKPEKDDKPLDADQIKMVSGVGGKDIRGPGILTGVIGTAGVREVNFGIATQVQKPVLITANAGQRDQVHFVLDMAMSEAQALIGQKVSIEGQINKQTDHVGKIDGATLKKVGGFQSGTYAQVSGQVQNRDINAIGGEAPPSGSWLVLDQPITFESRQISEVFLGYREFADGANVNVNGRLDAKSFGGVETPRTPYVELSGVSDVTAGEPTFDGKTFTSSVSGKPLNTVSWDRPQMYDAPAILWVLDPGQDKAFVGGAGGMRGPQMNWFHGFRDARPMVPPTEADIRSIGWNGDTPYHVATNQKLDLLHRDEMPDGVADGMSTSWYMHEESKTLYRFQEGGIAGFAHHMDQIVRGERPE